MKTKHQDFGPVYEPLNPDWSWYQVPGWEQDAVNLAIRKRLATSRMRRFRTVQVKRRIWWVVLTASEVSAEDFGLGDLPRGLTFSPREFWCRSRRRAQSLIQADAEAGGAGTMYPVEYRYCPVCGRMLLGPAAHDYRQKQLRPVKDWHYPAGPACSMDCKPKIKRSRTHGQQQQG